MARFEGKIEADGQGPLALDDVLDLLRARTRSGNAAIDRARACYLSSSEGWREAVKLLGGAFAEPGGGTDKK